MKTKQILWMSLCCYLTGAGVNVSAADAPASEPQPVKTGAPVAVSPLSTNVVEFQTIRPVQPSISVTKIKITEKKPDSLRRKRFSGPLYEIVKAKDAYQLFNPFAPARYGNGEENMPKDPSTGKPAGITLIAVH